MAALTADRNTPERNDVKMFDVPVAAATTIHAGALVMLDASGDAVPASTAVGLTPGGRADEAADNSGGAAGDETLRMRRGCFRFANDGGDPIDRSHIGGSAYAVDDQTVAATDGAGTRSACGTIRDIDALGVWIEI